MLSRLKAKRLFWLTIVNRRWLSKVSYSPWLTKSQENLTLLDSVSGTGLDTKNLLDNLPEFTFSELLQANTTRLFTLACLTYKLLKVKSSQSSFYTSLGNPALKATRLLLFQSKTYLFCDMRSFYTAYQPPSWLVMKSLPTSLLLKSKITESSTPTQMPWKCRSES
jgi:hypothetical protein